MDFRDIQHLRYKAISIINQLRNARFSWKSHKIFRRPYFKQFNHVPEGDKGKVSDIMPYTLAMIHEVYIHFDLLPIHLSLFYIVLAIQMANIIACRRVIIRGNYCHSM